jgi:hypothetical protein
MVCGDTVAVRSTAPEEMLEKYSAQNWIVVDIIKEIAGYSCEPVISAVPVNKNFPTTAPVHFFMKDMKVQK